MDQLQTRLDALEQQMHAVTRRLRWWRGLACSLVILAVFTWALPLDAAQEEATAVVDPDDSAAIPGINNSPDPYELYGRCAGECVSPEASSRSL